MLFILVALGLFAFALFYLADSGFFRGKRMMRFEGEIVDEAEDEIFDNTGGVKTRFFKVYEFEEDGEKKVVRSERPMKRIENGVGKKCVIYVDSKNRKAMERKDVLRYRCVAFFLTACAIGVLGMYFYIKLCVPGAVI